MVIKTDGDSTASTPLPRGRHEFTPDELVTGGHEQFAAPARAAHDEWRVVYNGAPTGVMGRADADAQAKFWKDSGAEVRVERRTVTEWETVTDNKEGEEES